MVRCINQMALVDNLAELVTLVVTDVCYTDVCHDALVHVHSHAPL